MNYQINRYKVNIYIGLYNGFHGFKTAFMTLKHNLKNKNKKIIKKKHKNTKRKKKKRTTAHPWCGGHSTSINTCGVWGARIGV